MRAGDDDRRQIADTLKTALDEGRLDLAEYDERLQSAYAAKTYAELDLLIADLPGSRPAQPAPVAKVAATAGREATAEWIRQVWGSWAFVTLLTTAIWFITSLAGNEWGYFWPIWVAGPWGLLQLFATIGGLAGGAPRKMVEERERKRERKERKRERRAALKAEKQTQLPPSPPQKWDMSDSKVADTPDHG
ncbi:protein of unknown function [Paractinoplanes atraurantiacus]|uniref:DUF1707 domain-containing protein n=2 Tax=Paractinoplanes atraurantiacus TaxID=1036182 RepID=A0A285IVC7_9ACTN|nr:protein of unknown function [Actinoplanes atraurantiacus]